MTNHLETIIARYEGTIDIVKEARASNSIEVEQIIRALNARDAVQIALKQQKIIPSSKLIKVIALDAVFREELKLISSWTELITQNKI